jgi:hypothetical protein
VAAKLIVLAVDGLEDSSSLRIEAALADRYSEGLVSAVAAADNDLVTILARADSHINVANTVAFLQTLGIKARESTDPEYQAAQSALAGRTIDVSTSAASLDGNDPIQDDAGDSTLLSVGASLDPLRDRFNRNKGRLRFIALLSPT